MLQWLSISFWIWPISLVLVCCWRCFTSWAQPPFLVLASVACLHFSYWFTCWFSWDVFDTVGYSLVNFYRSKARQGAGPWIGARRKSQPAGWTQCLGGCESRYTRSPVQALKMSCRAEAGISRDSSRQEDPKPGQVPAMACGPGSRALEGRTIKPGWATKTR